MQNTWFTFKAITIGNAREVYCREDRFSIVAI